MGPILIIGYKKVHQNTGFAFLMVKKYTKTEQEFVQHIYRSEIQSLFALSRPNLSQVLGRMANEKMMKDSPYNRIEEEEP